MWHTISIQFIRKNPHKKIKQFGSKIKQSETDVCQTENGSFLSQEEIYKSWNCFYKYEYFCFI